MLYIVNNGTAEPMHLIGHGFLSCLSWWNPPPNGAPRMSAASGTSILRKRCHLLSPISNGILPLKKLPPFAV